MLLFPRTERHRTDIKIYFKRMDLVYERQI
jgi:hypothetical protein